MVPYGSERTQFVARQRESCCVATWLWIRYEHDHDDRDDLMILMNFSPSVSPPPPSRFSSSIKRGVNSLCLSQEKQYSCFFFIKMVFTAKSVVETSFFLFIGGSRLALLFQR